MDRDIVSRSRRRQLTSIVHRPVLGGRSHVAHPEQRTVSQTQVVAPNYRQSYAAPERSAIYSANSVSSAAVDNTRYNRAPSKTSGFNRIAKKVGKRIRNLYGRYRRHSIWCRLGWALLALLIIFELFSWLYSLKRNNDIYKLSPQALQLIGEPRLAIADQIKLDQKSESYIFNQDYNPGEGVVGDSSFPKYSGQFNLAADRGFSIKDPRSNVAISLTPKQKTESPNKYQNRLIYPSRGGKVQTVYTFKSIALKEDIIINGDIGDAAEFKYKLSLPVGTEARMEQDGSLGIYGVSPSLLGNVTTGSEADAKLLDNARKTGEKNTLLFSFPAPFILEAGKKPSKAKAWYSYSKGELTIHSSNLKSAKYPITIDPTVYIETARKLMRGNNETNTEFDTDNELIQKGRTTGARINEWLSTQPLPSPTWDEAVAVAGGYIYTAGGQEVYKRNYNSAGTETFTVPTGVTQITVKMWGAGGGGGGGGSTITGAAGGGGGSLFATIPVTPGETLTLNVGAGGGGGTYGSNSSNGAGGGGYTAVFRGSTALAVAAGGGGAGGGRNAARGGAGGAGGGTSGTAGGTVSGGGGGGGATASAGGTAGTSTNNPGTAGASLQGGAGADGRNAAGADGGAANGGSPGGAAGGTRNILQTRAGGAGGGGGYFGGGGGGGSANTNGQSGGGGGGGSSYAIAGSTSVTNSAGSGATPGNSSDTERYGAGAGGTAGAAAGSGSVGTAGRLVLTWGSGTAVSKKVYWGRFDSATKSIVAANPGSGACPGWCNDSQYDLPAARRSMTMVSYNGFLYAIGGTDGTSRQSTIYIAKLGANGEPQLWHPTDTNKNNWVFWYQGTTLNGNTARSYLNAVAYNNRLYIFGGQTNASPGGTNTVEMADITPTGLLGAWTTTGMQALPNNRFGHAVQVYNDVLYLIGGNNNGTLLNTVYYSRLNNDGTMNTWVQTNSFNGARASMGGSMTALWGGYIYLSGGCLAVNGSGYCTSIPTDPQVSVQLASINADGSIAPWNPILNITNARIGYQMVAWQGGLYRLAGCQSQDPSTGVCTDTLDTVDYGPINQDGDASTVNNSGTWSQSAVGGNTCSGYASGDPNLKNCDLPPPGDNAGQGGQMSSMVVVNNGYIYNIGGCTNVSTTAECNPGTAMSGNTSYAALSPDGDIIAASRCGGTYVGTWCVDSTNRINGTAGVGSAASTVYNNVIYVIGGTDGSGTWRSTVYYNSLNSDGSLSGAWQTAASSGLPTNFPIGAGTIGTAGIGYGYAFVRSNPANASSVPGHLYYMGGCNGTSGIGCSNYTSGVFRCNIGTTGNVTGCSTSGQMQIDADNVNTGVQGLGLMAGTVYANRVYLVGGACSQVTTFADDTSPCANDNDTVLNSAQRKETIYAKIDSSENIVNVDTGLSTGVWKDATAKMSPVRRRAMSFGYNGYLYSLAGYSGSSSLQDLLFAKINVSTGDVAENVGIWNSSGVVVTPRWDLRTIVGNGYVYAIGGCGAGGAPSGCTSMQPQVQTFQLYNNDSGSVASYSASTAAYTTATDRWGASAAVLNGYLYVAGGCTSLTDCTAATNDVQYAPLSNADGSIGTWAAATSLPAARAWGQLEVAGGSLYYIGGQDSTATNRYSTVYYGTPSAGTIGWATASQGLPVGLSQHGATSWNGRLYVVGGLTGSSTNGTPVNTVYISPQLTSGGNITSAWSSSTAFTVARSGATAIAYANNLYVLGGYDGTNYLSDSQFSQINGTTGAVGSWTLSTGLPSRLSQSEGFAANGYMYLLGGRSSATSCSPNTVIAPISANTTIASGNNPTGLGEWYETNKKYAGGRYGMAVAYNQGKVYALGGGCTAPIGPNYTTGTIQQTGNTVTGSGTTWTDNYIGNTIRYADNSTATIINVTNSTTLVVSVSKTVAAGSTYTIIGADRNYYASLKSQPQVAKYSRMIDTDTDVFATTWLMNGLDNSIGAQWKMRYRSMTDPQAISGRECTLPSMSTWGQETNFGAVTLSRPSLYVPKNSSGTNTNCARYYYFSVSIDSSQAFGYPEDVTRGPTIDDLTIFFTADPSKRLIHGKTFTGGEQQPLDTPCRQSGGSNNADCPLP